MTIREQLVKDIDTLWMRVTNLREDPDISEELRNKLRPVSEKLAGCVSILTCDAGPTQADIAGEVVHVPAPF